MAKAPKPTNFDYLDPDASSKPHLLSTCHGSQTKTRPVFQPSKIAALAERIDQRAQQGLTLHLKPATARTVAMTLRLYAEGHPDLRKSHPHYVEDWTQEPHTVLAYCTNATLAVGAWEHYQPQHPQRNLIATWGGGSHAAARKVEHGAYLIERALDEARSQQFTPKA